MHQYAQGTLRTRTVARIELVTIGIHTIGVGNAHAKTTGGKQVGNQTHSGGFAVGASHCNHWDSTVFTIREHLFDDRLANIASFAK